MSVAKPIYKKINMGERKWEQVRIGKSFEKKDNMIYRLQHQTWIRLIQNLKVKSTEESLLAFYWIKLANWLF